MTRALLTVGYQGLTADALVRALRDARVETVIDVRAVPSSRKPGFSKRVLASTLEAAGIGYAHLPALGTPKPGRDAARRGDRAGLERIYSAHLLGETALGGLDAAVELASARRSCLLCFEREPLCCHRRIVADRMGERASFAVRHLHAEPAVPGRLRDHEQT